jgi:ribA/ribD-fused uncharacterized protein
MKRIARFKDKYGFLSNFRGCPIVFEGVTYASTEHAYQAAKTLDPAERVQFTERITAGIAKRKGRAVTMRPDWDEVKDQIMYELNVQKYQDVGLRRDLLATGDIELVEGNNWHDNHFGVCQCGGKDFCARDNVTGENVLGKILMRIRAEIGGETTMSKIEVLEAAKTVGFVGSRSCTQNQLNRLGGVAGYCALVGKNGISGGAQGADRKAQDKYKEYFSSTKFTVVLPWPAYNDAHVVYEGNKQVIFSDRYNKTNGYDVLSVDDRQDYFYAASEAYANCGFGNLESMKTSWKAMFGRNAYIVANCDVLVVAMNKDSRGTLHDIELARMYGKPVINVTDDAEWATVKEFLIFKKDEIEDAAKDEERWDYEEEKLSQRDRQDKCGYPEPSCEDINENRERLSSQDPYDESRLAEY